MNYNNPSVTFGDSSLYTREPMKNRLFFHRNSSSKFAIHKKVCTYLPPLCKGRWLAVRDGGVVLYIFLCCHLHNVINMLTDLEKMFVDIFIGKSDNLQSIFLQKLGSRCIIFKSFFRMML